MLGCQDNGAGFWVSWGCGCGVGGAVGADCEGLAQAGSPVEDSGFGLFEYPSGMGFHPV